MLLSIKPYFEFFQSTCDTWNSWVKNQNCTRGLLPWHLISYGCSKTIFVRLQNYIASIKFSNVIILMSSSTYPLFFVTWSFIRKFSPIIQLFAHSSIKVWMRGKGKLCQRKKKPLWMLCNQDVPHYIVQHYPFWALDIMGFLGDKVDKTDCMVCLCWKIC